MKAITIVIIVVAVIVGGYAIWNAVLWVIHLLQVFE
jgi:hypothetical protein